MSLKKLLNKRRENKPSDRVKMKHYSNKISYEELVEFESELGRMVFGPVPANGQREFFKDRGNVWIWYEKFTDNAGKVQEITVRYDVRPYGVFKKTSGGKFEKLQNEELNNFRAALNTYSQLVKSRLYC